MSEINVMGLVNKPPIDEIYMLDLVNKPDIMDEDALAHYGVLGMKWGVRRYQNPDGTLTEAGKKRAQKEERHKKKEHEKILKDRKKYLDNYFDLSEEDRRKADRYFDALEKMEKRDITSLTRKEKIRASRERVARFLPELIKTTAITAASIAALTVSADKIIKWLSSANGKAVIGFVRKI